MDWTSRYVKLVHLPDGHSAGQLRDAMQIVMATVPKRSRHTLTWDQGSEMAEHDKIAEHFSDGVFFADPASPWQRGSNENTNGLLRQYFPKGTDLSRHSAADLLAVETRVNDRPRKKLKWQTPAQAFSGHGTLIS